MKTCIWCRNTETEVKFVTEAHTIPKSLGGKNICLNVCDQCNSFYGRHYEGLPSVETILKETFNITRTRLSDTNDKLTRSNKKQRFSSIYFDVNMKKHTIELKLAYRLHAGFQEKICRQLKKGLYKIFLEETERQNTNGHDPKFDFIREFARYNLGDYPVFYFERRVGLIAMSNDWLENPQLFFNEEMQFKYLVREPSFMEFEFLGHVFSIAISRHWELALDNYLKKTLEAKREHFKNVKLVTKFNDIDLLLTILND